MRRGSGIAGSQPGEGNAKRITLVADWVGREYSDAAQVSTPKNVTAQVNGQPTVFSRIVQANGSYNVNDIALGVKENPEFTYY